MSKKKVRKLATALRLLEAEHEATRSLTNSNEGAVLRLANAERQRQKDMDTQKLTPTIKGVHFGDGVVTWECGSGELTKSAHLAANSILAVFVEDKEVGVVVELLLVGGLGFRGYFEEYPEEHVAAIVATIGADEALRVVLDNGLVQS